MKVNDDCEGPAMPRWMRRRTTGRSMGWTTSPAVRPTSRAGGRTARRLVPVFVTALAVAPVVAVAPPAQAATSCAVKYSVASQWPGGFQGGLEVTNTGDPWSAWTLTFG